MNKFIKGCALPLVVWISAAGIAAAEDPIMQTSSPTYVPTTGVPPVPPVPPSDISSQETEADRFARFLREDVQEAQSQANLGEEDLASLEKSIAENADTVQTLDDLLGKLEDAATTEVAGKATDSIKAALDEIAALSESAAPLLDDSACDLSLAKKESIEAGKRARSEAAENTRRLESQKGGDPVILSTGAFAYSDTDVDIPLFPATRNYTSGIVTSGSFGAGWTTSFDERIIRCYSEIHMQTLETSAQEIESLKSIRQIVRLQSYSLANTMAKKIEDQASAIVSERLEALREIDVLANRINIYMYFWNRAFNEGKYFTQECAQHADSAFRAASRTVCEYPPALEKAKIAQGFSDQAEQHFLSYTALSERIEAALEKGRAFTECMAKNRKQIEGSIQEQLDAELNDCMQQMETLGARIDATVAERESEYRQLKEASDRSAALQAKNALLFRFADRPYALTCGNDALIHIDGSGRTMQYDYKGNGIWMPANGSSWPVIESENGSDALASSGFIIRDRAGVKRIFSGEGLISEIKTASGKSAKILRNANGEAAGAAAGNRTWKITSKDGFITEIRASGSSGAAASCWKYAYSNGTLASCTDPAGNTVAYAYENGLLASIGKPDGSAVSVEYGLSLPDGSRLVTSTTDEEGFVERFEYPEPGKRTVHINQSGIRTEYCFDERKRTVREARADGTVITTLWSESGDGPEVRTFCTGYATFTERYDGEGLIASRTHPDGSTEFWERNDRGAVAAFTDRTGGRTEYDYDARGNICAEKKRGITIKTIEWNETGNPVLIRQSGLGDIAMTWNEAGLPASRTRLPLAHEANQEPVTESWTWDSEGRLLTETDGAGRIRKFVWGKQSESETSPEGLRTTREFNNRGDCFRITEQDESTGKKRITEISYDKRHLPISVAYPDGSAQTMRYRPDGKMIERIFNGRKTEYIYGADGTIQKTVESAGGIPISETCYNRTNTGTEVRIFAGGTAIRTILLDFDGNETANTDGEGNSTTTVRNGLGSILSVRNRFGGLTERIPDEDGYPCEILEDGERTLWMEHNEAGLPTRIRTSDGMDTAIRRNRFGLAERETNQAGEREYRYDRAGRLTAEIIRTTTEAASSSKERVRAIEYSKDGRTATMREGTGGQIKTATTDAWGQIVLIVDGEGASTKMDYDNMGRLRETTYADGTKTRYEYDETGKLARTIFADGSFENLTWDRAGNLTGISGPAGPIWTGRFDAAGNCIAERKYPGAEREYSRDRAGRITEIREAGLSVQTIRRSADGRTETVADAKGAERRYSFDRFGRLAAETDRLGRERILTRSAGGTVTEERSFGGKTVKHSFDPAALAYTTDFGNGETNTLWYDLSGVLVKAENEAGSISWSVDEAGNIAAQSDSVAREASFYEYDKAGRRVSLESGDRSIRYAYDRMGRIARISDSETVLETAFSYDSLGRETARTAKNGITTSKSYDAAGRETGVWSTDAAGKLIAASFWRYSAEGKRTHRIDGDGLVTVYEYSKQGQLSRVYNPDKSETRARLDADEARLTGETPSTARQEVRYEFSSDVCKDLEALFALPSHARTAGLKAAQNMLVEEYDYDANGNRTAWTTSSGTLSFEYDAEDRILRAGNTTFEHDAEGNLTFEKNLRCSVQYAYTGGNRMKFAESSDRSKGTHSYTAYAYDALGRRTVSSSEGEAPSRTVYDLYGFDILRTASVYGDGTPISAYASASRAALSSTGRYAYIEDAQPVRASADTGTEGTNEESFRGIKRPLSYNGKVLAVSLDPLGTGEAGNYYLAQGPGGSAEAVANSYGGTEAQRSYGPFGTPSEIDRLMADGSIPWGWTGKPVDPATGLIDFGYRDYHPALARFTTADPVRDGLNWYAYAENDPINFIDLWGLENLALGKVDMHDARWGSDLLGNSADVLVKKEGCYAAAFSSAATALTGKTVTPATLNQDKSNNFAKNSQSMLPQQAAAKQGLVQDYWTQANQGDLKNKINELNDSSTKYAVLAQVPYNSNGDLHWVGVNGGTIIDSGKEYIQATGSSKFDYIKESRPKDWVINGDTILIPTSDIIRIDTFTKNNK